MSKNKSAPLTTVPIEQYNKLLKESDDLFDTYNNLYFFICDELHLDPLSTSLDDLKKQIRKVIFTVRTLEKD